MEKFRIGYTQGVYDLFHVGHLNLLNNAKKQCDFLIVGINSDKLVESYKNKQPIINEHDRATIVSNIKCVDQVIIVNTLDKVKIHETVCFDAIFIGSDWKGNERWLDTEKQLRKVNAKVIYLDYTEGISSTILREKIK